MEDLKLENITPAKATRYLNKNHTNRSLRPGVAEKYASDMTAGKWTQCIVPIAFYEDGELADGQHRLWAITESGVPQKFYVLKNLPRSAGLNVDIGLGRSLVDNARIAGVDPDLSNELLAVTRAFAKGERSRGGKAGGVSNSQKLEWVNKYRVPCLWAIHNRPRAKNLNGSLVTSAIARAVSHLKPQGDPNEERLREFCRVMQTGVSNGEQDSAAVAIRNYLMANKNAASSPPDWYDTFKKVQNAIWYFMRRKPLNIIKGVSKEAYPPIEPAPAWWSAKL